LVDKDKARDDINKKVKQQIDQLKSDSEVRHEAIKKMDHLNIVQK